MALIRKAPITIYYGNVAGNCTALLLDWLVAHPPHLSTPLVPDVSWCLLCLAPGYPYGKNSCVAIWERICNIWQPLPYLSGPDATLAYHG
jgi:hypothetical protein